MIKIERRTWNTRGNRVTRATIRKRLRAGKWLALFLVVMVVAGASGYHLVSRMQAHAAEALAEDPVHDLVRTAKIAGVDYRATGGFGYPVGGGGRLSHGNDGDGYYVAREFLSSRRSGQSADGVDTHLGEDWNGEGGGDSDVGDAIKAVANGVVVYAGDPGPCWGRVLVVHHEAPEGLYFLAPDGRELSEVWSLYAHFDEVDVSVGDSVVLGARLGALGNDCCECFAHLHFEIVVDPRGPFPGGGYYSPGACESTSCGRVDPSEFIDLNPKP